MNREYYQKLNHIFQAALEYPPNQRAAYLDETCLDSALRVEVEELLIIHEQTDAFIDKPVFEVGLKVVADETAAAQPAQQLVGKQFGTYRLVREIGEGGMGVVYEAIRADDQFRKQAALKILRPGIDTATVIQRFRNERQILASLQHPNIAQLLDGGLSDDGRPYFVLEYIEGKPIDIYCDDHKLSISERLRLFCKVMSAVQFAHQNLVVHRDLKPGNILITDDGAPKLLDFGIAKVIKADMSTRGIHITESDLTQTGFNPMTPAYASPEQVRGEAITTATDVYLLGVVLYELLTGRRPFYFKSGRLDEAVQVICHQEPVRPSTAAIQPVEEPAHDLGTQSTCPLETISAIREGSPEKLRRRLTGDLDTIVLKALRKEPHRRYSSVEQFAEDIRRHLEGLPVGARKDTLGYRAEKFVHRNRLAVAAATLVTMSLFAGIITTAWQAQVARAERFRAEAAQTKAERREREARKLAEAALFDLHDKIENLSGSTPVREYLVQQGLQYLDALVKEGITDQELLYKVALGYRKLGDVQGRPFGSNLGNSTGALSSYQNSLKLFETLHQRNLSDPDVTREWSIAIERIGELMSRIGNLGEAISKYQEVLSIREGLNLTNPQDINNQRILGDCYIKKADLLLDSGDLIGALELYQKALPLRQMILAADPSNPKSRRSVAVCLNRIGTTFRATGDLLRDQIKAESLPLAFYNHSIEKFLLATDIFEQLSKTDPANTYASREVASSYIRLATVYNNVGNPLQAQKLARQSLSIVEKLSHQDPQNSEIKSELVFSNTWTAKIYLGTKNLQKALDYYQNAILAEEELVRKDVLNEEYLYVLANLYELTGTACLQIQNQSLANEYYNKAFAIYEKLYLTNSNSLIYQTGFFRIALKLNQSLMQAGKNNQATCILTSVFSKDLNRPKNQPTLFELDGYAKLLLFCKPEKYRDPVTALRLTQQAHQISQGRNLSVLHTLATAYAFTGNQPKAIETVHQLVDLLSRVDSIDRSIAMKEINSRLLHFYSRGDS